MEDVDKLEPHHKSVPDDGQSFASHGLVAGGMRLSSCKGPPLCSGLEEGTLSHRTLHQRNSQVHDVGEAVAPVQMLVNTLAELFAPSVGDISPVIHQIKLRGVLRQASVMGLLGRCAGVWPKCVDTYGDLNSKGGVVKMRC